MILMLTFSVVPAFAEEVKSPEATVVTPVETQPAEKGKTPSSSDSSVVTPDKGSKSPQTGSDNAMAYAVLLTSAAACCAAVIKFSKSK